jgi:type VI secretion system protein ImpM
MNADLSPGPGFFGKVRTHGDFVSRRLPAEFLTSWDEGLQEGMVLARRRFEAQWLPLYLNAPVWCFAWGPHVYGPSAWAGVLMSGVDRVGRYFPFTIAQAFEGLELERRLAGAQGWYDRLAELALSTLMPEFSLDEFDAALRSTGLPGGNDELVPWRLAVRDASDDSFATLLIKAAVTGQGIWWSDGSPAVPASARSAAGAMSGLQFASLLDLGADEWDWVVELTSTAGA